MKIKPPSLNSGRAFWTVNSVPRAFSAKTASKCSSGDLAEPALLAHPGTRPQHVDRALLPLDGVEQTVQIVEIGDRPARRSHCGRSAPQLPPACPSAGPR